MPTGYTPIFQISKGGTDITDRFSGRCVSIRVDFADGDGQGDGCMIALDDRDWAIERPNVGETISIALGYEEVGMAAMGSYVIDEVIFALPPKVIYLKGKPTEENEIKSGMIQNFQGKTLGDIFSDMAQKGGLSADVHPDLKDKKIEERHMTGSPLQFTQELARHFGAIAKFANGKLTVLPIDQGQNASGESGPILVFRPEHFGDLQVKHNTAPEYSSAKAAYTDPKDYITRFTESFGSAGKSVSDGVAFLLDRKFNNKEEAEAATKSQMQSLQSMTGEADMTLAKGDPWIRDQQRVLLQDFRDGINGSYVISLVSHTYVKGDGIKTQIHAKAPGDGANYESAFGDSASEQKFYDLGTGFLTGEFLANKGPGRDFGTNPSGLDGFLSFVPPR